MNFTIKTIGCKVNTYESSKIRDELCKLGFNYIDVEEKDKYSELDFYIVNTCSVTKIADKKSRQMLHLAKKYNPNVKVIAIGCMVDSLSVRADDDIVGAKHREPTDVGKDIIRPRTGELREPHRTGELREPHRTGELREPHLDGVDYLISNKDKDKLKDILLSLTNTVGAKHREPTDVGKDIIRPRAGELREPHRTGELREPHRTGELREPHRTGELCEPNHNRIRANIKIQDGCNQYCTYCIIPFLRGNIISRDNDDIISEIKEKVKNGVKEIVLTGIHLSSFGLDRVNKTYESEGAIDIARKELLTIMSQIAEIDGVERIRLGSLEPRIIDENFLKTLLGLNVAHIVSDDGVGKKHCEPASVEASELAKKFCANFCLSLQSGCDKTLKRMNRHYTTADYENACNLIRKHMPYATITTDVIVGFPGETEEDFAASLDFVKRMKFYNPNIFPYSRRQGTKADKMPDQLTNEEKHSRSVLMIAECEKISKEIEEEYFTKYSDRASDVLVEESYEENGKKYGIGYTKEYIKRVIAI